MGVDGLLLPKNQSVRSFSVQPLRDCDWRLLILILARALALEEMIMGAKDNENEPKAYTTEAACLALEQGNPRNNDIDEEPETL